MHLSLMLREAIGPQVFQICGGGPIPGLEVNRRDDVQGNGAISPSICELDLLVAPYGSLK
jgi:hypothetical protein